MVTITMQTLCGACRDLRRPCCLTNITCHSRARSRAAVITVVMVPSFAFAAAVPFINVVRDKPKIYQSVTTIVFFAMAFVFFFAYSKFTPGDEVHETNLAVPVAGGGVVAVACRGWRWLLFRWLWWCRGLSRAVVLLSQVAAGVCADGCSVVVAGDPLICGE